MFSIYFENISPTNPYKLIFVEHDCIPIKNLKNIDFIKYCFCYLTQSGMIPKINLLQYAGDPTNQISNFACLPLLCKTNPI